VLETVCICATLCNKPQIHPIIYTQHSNPLPFKLGNVPKPITA